jgi:hypothetical protein
MRRRTFWLLALMLAGALALPSLSDARRSRCQPKRSRTVVATGAARIFTLSKVHEGNHVQLVYGCAFSKNRRYLLSRVEDDGEYATGSATQDPRLLGRRVAYVLVGIDSARSKFGGGNPGSSLVVKDLRTGRVVSSATTPENAGVADFDATRSGALAWIEAAYHDFAAPTYRVFKQDAGGQTLLDSTSGISGDSLAISGSTVYWTNAGSARSTTLR